VFAGGVPVGTVAVLLGRRPSRCVIREMAPTMTLVGGSVLVVGSGPHRPVRVRPGATADETVAGRHRSIRGRRFDRTRAGCRWRRSGGARPIVQSDGRRADQPRARPGRVGPGTASVACRRVARADDAVDGHARLRRDAVDA
jgi:hypothetical protein